jgi:hypothetical protein
VNDGVDAGDLILVGDAEAHGPLDDRADDPGEPEGVDPDAEPGDGLHAELLEAAGIDEADAAAENADVERAGVRMLQAGVIATSPASAPDAAPMEVGLPSLMRSTINQPRIAADGATSVLIQAIAATPSTAASDPELNPNQPNQSSAAPSRVSGTL